MLQRAKMSDEERNAAASWPAVWLPVRASRTKASGVDALMHEFSLPAKKASR